MYVPIDNGDGRWRVDFMVAGFEPITVGYAQNKDHACRIAGAMNGGDMDRIIGAWDYFIDGEEKEPIVVDLLNDPPQL